MSPSLLTLLGPAPGPTSTGPSTGGALSGLGGLTSLNPGQEPSANAILGLFTPPTGVPTVPGMGMPGLTGMGMPGMTGMGMPGVGLGLPGMGMPGMGMPGVGLTGTPIMPVTGLPTLAPTPAPAPMPVADRMFNVDFVLTSVALYPPVVAFTTQELSCTFFFKKPNPQQPHITIITAVFTSTHPTPLTDLNFQAAPPKHLKYTLEFPSGKDLMGAGSTISQMITATNSAQGEVCRTY